MVIADGESDKKKSVSRRPHRRSKYNGSVSGTISGSELRVATPEFFGDVAKQSDSVDVTRYTLLKRPVQSASDAAINITSTIHREENNKYSQPLSGAASSALAFPTMNQADTNCPPSCCRLKFFNPHLPIDDAIDAVEKGDAFKALFRANSHNRQEAYCTIEGVPVDIFVSGYAAQNRAVQGDIVIIQIDPLSCWTKMKGFTMPSNNTAAAEDCELTENTALAVEDSELTEDLNDVNLACLHSENIAELDNENGHAEYLLCDKVLQYEKSINCTKEKVEASYNDVADSCSPESSVRDNVAMDNLKKLVSFIDMFPDKRPTGRVLSISQKSVHREAIVGFLNVKPWCNKRFSKENPLENGALSSSDDEYIHLVPTDPRYPKMRVLVNGLPDVIRTRLEANDETIEMELVAAVMDDWSSESLFPNALVLHAFGKGSEVDALINSILYKNRISQSDFPSESLSSLPHNSWEVPLEEIENRRDLRKSCIFTIDPPTATDLDDALSFEQLPNGRIRIGVHIADVSFFVLPGTGLDIQAQTRSTSIYLVRNKIAMLPLILSDNLVSLNPGVNRLAFSIMWDMDAKGEILDRWIGRSVIHSCCKLTYDHVQNIITKKNDDHNYPHDFPKLHANFKWSDVIVCLHGLFKISKILRKKRMENSALCLETSKVTFDLDEVAMVHERKESNILVEEFMLLANITAAEVISRTFPDFSLLRRHPEPHPRKLRELKTFCSKLGLNLDASSSGQLNKSLEQIREKLKNERLLIEILLFFASRSMQAASYFCSGDLSDNINDWNHYALGVPLYTHFTSPLRRYPDIEVHRTLAAVVDAEVSYLNQNSMSNRSKKGKKGYKCFTGLHFDKDAAESNEGRKSLTAAALKHCVPGEELLSKIAAHCNERKLAARLVKDSCADVYMWMALVRKEVLLTEATVMGLGPRFMSIYIHKLAIERRIYYNDVDGLTVEWLENTSTLILGLNKYGHRSLGRTTSSHHRSIAELALVVNPCDTKVEPTEQDQSFCNANDSENINVDEEHLSPSQRPDITPAVLPIVVGIFSTVPVALYPVGGDGCPIEVEARLFLSSYFG